MSRNKKILSLFTGVILILIVALIARLIYIFNVQPFSNEELLKHYFGLKIKDVDELKTYYEETFDVQLTYFYFICPDSKIRGFLNNKCSLIELSKNEIKLDNFLRESRNVDWWHPPRKTPFKFYELNSPNYNKNIHFGSIYYNKENGILYALFGYVY